MTRTFKMVIQLAMVAIFLPTVVSADEQDVIDYREHIMKTLDEQARAESRGCVMARDGQQHSGCDASLENQSNRLVLRAGRAVRSHRSEP